MKLSKNERNELIRLESIMVIRGFRKAERKRYKYLKNKKKSRGETNDIKNTELV